MIAENIAAAPFPKCDLLVRSNMAMMTGIMTSSPSKVPTLALPFTLAWKVIHAASRTKESTTKATEDICPLRERNDTTASNNVESTPARLSINAGEVGLEELLASLGDIRRP